MAIRILVALAALAVGACTFPVAPETIAECEARGGDSCRTPEREACEAECERTYDAAYVDMCVALHGESETDWCASEADRLDCRCRLECDPNATDSITID